MTDELFTRLRRKSFASDESSLATPSRIGTDAGGAYLQTRGVTALPFSLANVPADATTEMIPNDAAMDLNVPRMPVPWPGTIVGVSVRFSGSISNGQVIVQPTVDGASVWSALTLTSGSSGSASQNAYKDAFTDSEVVGLRLVTNAGFLPTTLECSAWLYVIFDYDGE